MIVPTQPTLILTTFLFLGLALFACHNRRRHAQLLATITHIHWTEFPSQFLKNSRSIDIYLPPAYREQPNQRYPVLYLHDGQDKEVLHLHETLARLTRYQRIQPLIVVAIPTNANRLHEYGTAITPNARGLGSQAADYQRFVTEELMPALNQKFRTLTDPRHTAILGASLGGLCAFDMAWHYPYLFGIVGVFSGSFWWRASADNLHITPNQLILPDLVRRGPKREGFRAWFEAGTHDERDDRDHNGIIDAIQDTLELIDELYKLGYRPQRDVTYLQVEGGQHNYETWSKWLPEFLEWSFGKKE